MSHAKFGTFETAHRSSAAVWHDDALNHQPHFGEVAMALLPASLILAAATALLVALL
jgi:hypothetical protein